MDLEEIGYQLKIVMTIFWWVKFHETSEFMEISLSHVQL